ncbi:MAG TPA: hypothetical protein VEM95_06280, partial [Thermoplasmata archaeon]|nr:hypothetical protein [Thermoplasmata archaeon]
MAAYFAIVMANVVTTGVRLPFVVASSRRHWRYRAGALTIADPFVVAQPDHERFPGSALPPVRVSTATDVCSGVSAVTSARFHTAPEPASTGMAVK